jgi:ferredoxin
MTYPKMQHMPLTSAYLCQDCNSVGNCASQCPACASEVLMGLAAVLDRDVEIEDESVSRFDYLTAMVA